MEGTLAGVPSIFGARQSRSPSFTQIRPCKRSSAVSTVPWWSSGPTDRLPTKESASTSHDSRRNVRRSMMGTALLITRLLLALVFATAGVAKLADRAGSRRAIIDFGVPAFLAAPLGIMLPLAELLVAAALLSPATTWWGALGALALLILFMAGISFNLARRHKPERSE